MNLSKYILFFRFLEFILLRLEATWNSCFCRFKTTSSSAATQMQRPPVWKPSFDLDTTSRYHKSHCQTAFIHISIVQISWFFAASSRPDVRPVEANFPTVWKASDSGWKFPRHSRQKVLCKNNSRTEEEADHGICKADQNCDMNKIYLFSVSLVLICL